MFLKKPIKLRGRKKIRAVCFQTNEDDDLQGFVLQMGALLFSENETGLCDASFLDTVSWCSDSAVPREREWQGHKARTPPGMPRA